MKKLLLIFFMLLFCMNVNAKSLKNDLNSIISDSNISKDSISISLKKLDSGKPVYELNEKILMHPASVQKILTLPAFMDILGEDYCFTSGIYLRSEGEYLIKLGADPYLTFSDIKSLVREIDTKTVQKIYIDSSIIEMKDWGEGWQWDDDLNVSMPRFNSYNLDKNLIKITVMPQDGKVIVINPAKYPLVFFNNITIGEENKVSITRENSISSNTLTLNGAVARPCTLYIPTKNLKRYFEIKLTQALEDRNIYLKENFISSVKSDSDKLIKEIQHPITKAENDVLLNSNNMVIETVAKLAGAKAYNKIGADTDGIKIFNSNCDKFSLNNSRIRLVDASGVSKNNLADSDFITEYLVKMKDDPTLAKMAKPSEGTLSNRLMPLKENLRAKTGTLSDISSIAGFLTTKSGAKYAFCIIINDPKSTNSDKKNLEDYLIRAIYLQG